MWHRLPHRSVLCIIAGVPGDDRLRRRFETLFRETYAELCNFVVQFVHSRAVAEELVQDLFLRLWERRAQWAAETPSRTYLYHAARNRALDHLKHERIASMAPPETSEEDEPFPAAERELHAADLRTALDAAIAELPDRTRQVFILCKGNGLSYLQIAKAMDISVKTVEAQMARAFRILRGRLAMYL